MSFEPKFQRTQTEREDDKNPGQRIHNESSKLPGHLERMKAHCKRVVNAKNLESKCKTCGGSGTYTIIHNLTGEHLADALCPDCKRVKERPNQPIKTGCAIPNPKAFE